jgi:hypothetical protein
MGGLDTQFGSFIEQNGEGEMVDSGVERDYRKGNYSKLCSLLHDRVAI